MASPTPQGTSTDASKTEERRDSVDDIMGTFSQQFVPGIDQHHDLAHSTAQQQIARGEEGCVHLGIILVFVSTFIAFVPMMVYQQSLHASLLDAIMEEWLVDERSRVIAMGHMMATPFTWPLITWGIFHLDKVIKQHAPSKPRVMAEGLLISSLLQLRVTASQVLVEEYMNYFMFYLQYAMWMIGLYKWYGIIWAVQKRAHAYVDTQDQVVEDNPAFQKQVAIMKSFTRWNKPAQDAIYSFDRPKSAYQMLGRYIRLTMAVAGFIPTMMFVLWYLSVELSSSLFIVVMMMSPCLALGGFSTVLPQLFHIAHSRPFYIGDIISTGKGPSAITGFVENFTTFNVVIRDFDAKQVWLHYSDFGAFNVHNWTRRHTKPVLLNFGINGHTDPARVQEFLKQIKVWVKGCDKINHKGYVKVALTSMNSGFNLCTLFFPCVGQSKKSVREECIGAFMKVSWELKVALVPQTIMSNFSRDDARQQQEGDESV